VKVKIFSEQLYIHLVLTQIYSIISEDLEYCTQAIKTRFMVLFGT